MRENEYLINTIQEVTLQAYAFGIYDYLFNERNMSRAYTYQGFSIDLVSFVPPFGKIVGFLLTFPFYIGSGGHSLG